jgi:hypothetical protein
VAEERDERAADEWSDRRRQADRRAEEAEGATTLGALEELLDEPGDLRGEHAAGGALRQPGGGEPPRTRGQTGGGARHGEAGEPHHEHASPAPRVADPAGGHQHQPEGERVTGEDPLQVARGRPQPVRIDGRATLTIETSSSVMNPATRQTASARQRLGSASGVADAPGPVVGTVTARLLPGLPGSKPRTAPGRSARDAATVRVARRY